MSVVNRDSQLPAFIHIPKNAGSSVVAMLKDKIRCYRHGTDVRELDAHIAQIVVLRDPVERFCSALQYAFDYWSKEPHLRLLIDLGLTNHNDIIDAFRDPHNRHHKAVCDEILNHNHCIGTRTLKYKWTYTAQCEWIHRPRYVVMFDNLASELAIVCASLGVEQPKNIAHTNASRRKVNKVQLTPENTEFLKQLYAEDYALLNMYCRIPADIRCTGKLIYDEDGVAV